MKKNDKGDNKQGLKISKVTLKSPDTLEDRISPALVEPITSLPTGGISAHC